MTSIGEHRLREVTAGHPLAVERLRQMNAVIEAAVARSIAPTWAADEALDKALREGGWL